MPSAAGTDRRWLAWLALGLGGVVTVAVACFGLCFGLPCFSTGLRYGMWLDECPATDLRLGARVDANGLVRGGEGTVEVLPYARHLRGEGADAWVAESTLWRGASVELALLDDEGEPVEGLVVDDRDKRRGWRTAEVTLPEVTDGDYVLRATVQAPFETLEVDTELPLYAPAIAHLMTDRPLYKPGQTVLLRSVTFRRPDLEPLDERPGRWRIVSPQGDEMLVEKDEAGAFGVADTTFPLDPRAPQGTWTAQWITGEARDEVSFEVRPFQLPRFTVDVQPGARWYGISDTVRLEGTARYTSGAPVREAPVQIRLRRVEGRWPMPLAWEEPIAATTDRAGRFEVEVGQVPADLIERAELRATVQVTEEAGESATGATRVVLSKDDLQVEAVTELGDGLVGGFNNRVYLRVATPDGQPLPGAEVTVTNPWDTRAEAREAQADADGVVAVQVDPGDPVTVVLPAAPVRVRPLTPDDPALERARELLDGRSLDLAERRALDAAVPAIEACGDLAPGGRQVTLAVRASAGGGVFDVLTGDDPVDRCVADAVRGVRFPVDDLRTYAFTWRVPDSLVPSFRVDLQAAWGAEGRLENAWEEAARQARRCVPRGTGISGSTVLEAHWRLSEGSQGIEATFTPRITGTGLSAPQVACVRRAFAGARLAAESGGDAMGTARITLSVPQPPGSRQPGDTTQTAYELKVAAAVEGSAIGDTRLVLPVGSIPALRLRAEPTLAHPGDEVSVQMFRGPDFRGEIPEELVLRMGDLRIEEAEVDADTRTATFTLPEDRDGFYHVEVPGARAIVFARPADPLGVEVGTDQAAYRPGATAKLTVATRAGERPVAAGVGLSGVDRTLGQLAPLLGPDDQGRVTVRAEADEPAFGAFDPRALVLGQVRGENAARAAVLRITQLPMDAGGDERLYVEATSTHHDEEVLITSFYRAYEALLERVRTWEAEAPEGEMMTPERMVGLWSDVLKALRRADEPAVDAFGRPLTLDRLPPDLLAQVDPYEVVREGTRLPEDVVSWEQYVDEEVAR